MSQPPKFHVGQAVVCTHDFGWKQADGEKPANERNPRKDRVYIVKDVVKYPQSPDWLLLLVEIPKVCFSERGFAPVEPLANEALAELLADTLEPVTA